MARHRRNKTRLDSIRSALYRAFEAGKNGEDPIIVAALAAEISELRSEQVKEGLARAEARGVVLGRPRTDCDEEVETAAALIAEGYSVRSVASKLNISRGTLIRRLREREGLPPREGGSVPVLSV